MPASSAFPSFSFQHLTNGKRIASIEIDHSNGTLGPFRLTCKFHREAIGNDHVVLHVSGRITGEHVSTLRTLLEEESGALTLDLKDVQLVDGEAVNLLAVHESNGIRITNCPSYIREWIRRERDAT